jgi:hypothetical protein
VKCNDFFDRRDEVATREEPSPHFAGRAQPGDVIGVETRGEQTHVGETTEDENNRRRDAEDEFATGSNRRGNRGEYRFKTPPPERTSRNARAAVRWPS